VMNNYPPIVMLTIAFLAYKSREFKSFLRSFVGEVRGEKIEGLRASSMRFEK
jgi:hypothetical protein